MSKEYIIVGWCDGEHDEPVNSAIERTLTFDSDQPREADLCEECDKIIQAAKALMARGVVYTGKKKQAAAKARTPAEQHPCEICPAVSISRAGLAAHLKSRHDLTMNQLKELSPEDISTRRKEYENKKSRAYGYGERA